MLTLSGLTVAFGDGPVVSDVSFTLKRGEILGIVGESGSGKSITALTLLGLQPATARVTGGSAHFSPNDSPVVDLLKLNEAELRKLRGSNISMVFQEPLTCLNPSMRCGVQVLEAVTLNTHLRGKEAKAKCINLLAEMQVSEPEKIYRSYPHQLSGGQKQRVVIAIALAGRPSLLIADEPTTALDVTVQKGLLQLLKQLRERYQMGMLFISHDLGVISEIADRVIIMKDGEIVESGNLSDVFKNPSHPYTQALLGSRPKMPACPDSVSNGSTRHIPENEKPIRPEPATLFDVKNLTAQFILRKNFLGKPTKAFIAISHLDLELFDGESLGLVGESGSGKTTLGRSLSRLMVGYDGSISYRGVNLNSMTQQQSAQFRAEVQLIFQDPYSSLNPRLTIGQALSEPLRVHKLCRGKKDVERKVYELLDKVLLAPDSYYRYPHEFSGGQRQRIVIARALAMSPRVLICDEIVSALDVTVQAQILSLLKSLKEELGLTYLFISHDLAVVSQFCNRVVILRDGVIVESGPTSSVFTNPTNGYTKSLISSIPGV